MQISRRDTLRAVSLGLGAALLPAVGSRAEKLPSEAEVLGFLDGLANWKRWGAEDELGALNLITPAKRAQAARLVRPERQSPARSRSVRTILVYATNA